jgi:hypothetical protein
LKKCLCNNDAATTSIKNHLPLYKFCSKKSNCMTCSLTVFTQCYSNSRDSRNPSCPVCQDSFNELAQPLPFAHCSQSRLVCAISGLPLNEHNLPMMLPNGYVYGEQVSFDISELSVINLVRCTPVEYVYFPNMHFAILNISLLMIFIYCRYICSQLIGLDFTLQTETIFPFI